MNILFSGLISIMLFVLFLPCVKVYQLKGYNVKNYLENLFEQKYSFFGKNKLVFTKRMTRFLILFFIFEFFIWFAIFSYSSFWWLQLIDFAVNILIFPLILSLLHYILLPIEISIQRFYIYLTKKKLKKFKGIKIAITGSYGKTSTKNILNSILSKRFKVTISPQNYNTPMGVAKTVLKELKSDSEIAIFEMGARHRGDIKKLCDIIKPDIGILTSVGMQHIETFKSLENILDTKFELCESMIQKICFFDCCSENTKKLFAKASCKKIALDENMIKNVKLSSNGGSFELDYNKSKLKISTKLLGNFMIEDISLAVLVSLYLGVLDKDIKDAIEKLKPTKHRLEIMGDEKLTIIDDSYNSNFDGFKEALNVLSKFRGEKIIVTPGLVEMGTKQYEYNFKIGKEIAKVCDKAIIMNKTNKNALKNGILSENNEFKIYFANEREEQQKLLKDILNDVSVVLFENDLPDDYK